MSGSTEDRLRDALVRAAGDTTPAPQAWPGIEAAIADRGRRSRRRRRSAIVIGAAAAVVVLVAIGAVLRQSSGDEEIRVGDDRTTTTPAPAPPLTSAPPPVSTETVPSTTAPAPTGDRPPVAVAVSEQNRIVVLDTATGRALRVLYQGPANSPNASAGRIAGLSLSPDGRTVWFSVGGDIEQCGDFGVYRVPLEGGEAERVATGGSPAVSPDGRSLAYAASAMAYGGPSAPHFSCLNTLVVRDLATGTERSWLPTVNGWNELMTVERISWAPDSRRFAFDQVYEGSDVRVLDTTVPGTLEVARPVRLAPPYDWVESLEWPVWLPGGDLLGIVARCCYAHEGPHDGEAVALMVDAATGQADELHRLPTAGGALDVDATGRHVVIAQGDGRLVMVGPDDQEEQLGQGFRLAVW